MREYWEREDAKRGGPGADISKFVQPLLERATDPESVRKALDLGLIFWNMALLKDQREAEEILQEMLDRMPDATEQERKAFLDMAHRMIARHMEMFPELHVNKTAVARKV